MRLHRAARRSRARVAIAFVALALGLVSRIARADASFALSWRDKPGATACVTEASLRDAVEKKLGRDPFTDHDRADITIEGEASCSGGRCRASVLQRDRNGTVLGSRDANAESCSSLLRATAVVVALFIEPDGPPEKAQEKGQAKEQDREPPPTEEHAVSPPVAAPPDSRPTHAVPPEREARRPAPATRAPFGLMLGIGGAASSGLLPSTAAAIRAGARLERIGSRWSFEWSAGYWLPQSFQSEPVRGTLAGVDQQVRACLSPAPRLVVRVDACAGAFWGAIVPTTSGVRARNDTWRPLAGPVAAIAAQLREGVGAVRLELGATAPVAGRALYYQGPTAGLERVHVTDPVLIFVGLSGLVTIF